MPSVVLCGVCCAQSQYYNEFAAVCVAFVNAQLNAATDSKSDAKSAAPPPVRSGASAADLFARASTALSKLWLAQSQPKHILAMAQFLLATATLAHNNARTKHTASSSEGAGLSVGVSDLL